jgi:hypothetical protein
MMRFFRDHAEANEVCYRLDNLGVKNSQICACVRDRKQLQCENFMSYCPNGVYVEVPEMYASTLETLARIAKYGQGK